MAGSRSSSCVGEELVHARAKCFVTLAKGGDFLRGDALRPTPGVRGCEASNSVEVAGMNPGGLPGLDGRKDVEGLGPPVDVDNGRIQAEGFQFANCGLEAGDNVRLAVEQKTCIDDGNAG